MKKTKKNSTIPYEEYPPLRVGMNEYLGIIGIVVSLILVLLSVLKLILNG